jgi:anti-sigma regulatory factor (Ser/Thr protein kinase)
VIPLAHMEATFQASPTEAAHVRQFLASSLTGLVLPDRVDDAVLAGDELAVNVIRYTPGTFTIGIDVEDRFVTVHVVDSGGGVTVPQARAVTQESEGGRGLPIVEAVTDGCGCVQASRCCCATSATGWCSWFRINRPSSPAVLPAAWAEVML